MGAVIEGREVKLQLVFLFKMQQQRNVQIFAKMRDKKLILSQRMPITYELTKEAKEDR